MIDLGSTAYALPGSMLPVSPYESAWTAHAVDPLARYSASSPTAWVPWPMLDGGAACGSSLIDALRAIAFRQLAIAAQAEAAGARQDAAVGVSGAGPTAVAAASPDPGTSSTRAVLGYSRSASKVSTPATPTVGGRRVGSEVWAGRINPARAHVTQVVSRFNRRAPGGNRDCGPVSVVMVLRLLGRKVPGAPSSLNPRNVQHAVRQVRMLAGQPDESAATTNIELERALARSGVVTTEISDLGSIRRAVLAGHPVILNGNPNNQGSYGRQMVRSGRMVNYDGAHWIVVSGYDSRTRRYIINDPLATGGVAKVTAAQLEAYRDGSIGIEVARS